MRLPPLLGFLLFSTATFSLLLHASSYVLAASVTPIRIGEISSATSATKNSTAYRNGWQLAVAQINAHGGILGRPLEVRSRADGGTATSATQAATQLIDHDGVTLLFSASASPQALALAQLAEQRRLPYLITGTTSDQAIGQKNSRYTFRLSPSTRMQVAALAPRALALRRPRWAIVHTDDAYGQEIAMTFQAMMTAFQSNAEIVSRQPLHAHQNPNAIVDVINSHRPDALLVVLHDADLSAFLRAGQAINLFSTRPVIAIQVELDTFQNPAYPLQTGQAPDGWMISGYSPSTIDSSSNTRFVQAYQAHYQQPPTYSALLGYTAILSLADALNSAQTTDADALADALAGLKLDTPYGPIQYRKIDHQATLSIPFGVIAIQDGNLEIKHVEWIDGARLQLPDHLARRMREPKSSHVAATETRNKDEATTPSHLKTTSAPLDAPHITMTGTRALPELPH